MDGQSGILIAVRVGSSRLPGKALLQLQGQPILAQLISRLQRAALPRAIVVCTTERAEDDELVEIARRMGVGCVRGSETDVLARYLLAAERYDLDVLVTADGDDVLCDPEIVDAIIVRQAETGADFVQCAGLPYGTYPYALTRAALARVCAAKQDENTEGWGRFFTAGGFKTAELRIDDPALRHPEYRLTLDYAEDFALLEAIFDRLGPANRYFTLREVFALLQREPKLAAINADLRAVYERHFQKYRAQQR